MSLPLLAGGAPALGSAPVAVPPHSVACLQPTTAQPPCPRADGTFTRGEDGLWDTPEAARWILSSLRDNHAAQLADLKTPAGQPLAALIEEGLAAATKPAAVVAAAIAAKEALAAQTEVPTLIAIDDYNALYSAHTGAVVVGGSGWVGGWLAGVAVWWGRRLSGVCQLPVCHALCSHTGSACTDTAAQARTLHRLPHSATLTPRIGLRDLRFHLGSPSLPPAGYYESVHNFHRRRLAPDELRLVRHLALIAGFRLPVNVELKCVEFLLDLAAAGWHLMRCAWRVATSCRLCACSCDTDSGDWQLAGVQRGGGGAPALQSSAPTRCIRPSPSCRVLSTIPAPLKPPIPSPSPAHNPQVQAFRVLEQPAPANGVTVAAPTFGQTISAKLRLPRPQGSLFEVPRLGLEEVTAVAEYYSSEVLGDDGYRESF